MQKLYSCSLRRPLAIACLAFILAVAAAYLLSLTLSAIVIFAIAAVFFAVFTAARGKMRQSSLCVQLLLILVFSGAGFVVSLIGLNGTEKALERVRAKDAPLVVRVSTVEPRGDAARVTADIRQAGAARIRGISVLFYDYRGEMAVGDELTATMSFYPGEQVSNGTLRLSAARVKPLQLEKGAASLLARAEQLRKSIESSLYETMPDADAAVAAAMLTGDRSGMTAERKTLFQRTGISHIVVVSGLHISLLLGMLSRALKRLYNPVVKMALIAVLTLALMFFYGFTPSVLRACTMGLIAFFGDVFYLPSDSATSLAVAAAAILLFSPSAILSASFQLSFACSFAIVVVFRRVERAASLRKPAKNRTIKLLAGLRNALALTAVVTVTTMPVLIMQGMPLSLVSPLTNPLVVMIVPVLLFLSLAIALFYPLIPFVGGVFGLWATLLSKAITAIATTADRFRFASIDVGDGLVQAALILSALALVGYLSFSKKRLRAWVLLICLLPAALGVVTNAARRAGSATVSLYNGNALILREGAEAALYLREMRADEVDYLASYLRTRGVVSVNSVLLLSQDRALFRAAGEVFSDADVAYAAATDGFLETGGLFSVNDSDGCVIINHDGLAVSVVNNGHHAAGGGKAVLYWRDAAVTADLSPSDSGFAALYSDTALSTGRTFIYGYGDIVEVTIKNDAINLEIR